MNSRIANCLRTSSCVVAEKQLRILNRSKTIESVEKKSQLYCHHRQRQKSKVWYLI